ncbi:hypothetical protein ES708_17726 [subsurface metagenome]
MRRLAAAIFPPPLFPSPLASCLALRLSPAPALLSLSFRQGPCNTTHTRSLARARRGLLRRPLRSPTAPAPRRFPPSPPAPGGGRSLARENPSLAPLRLRLRAAGPEDAGGNHPKTPAGPGPAPLRLRLRSARSLHRRPPSTAATIKGAPKGPYIARHLAPYRILSGIPPLSNTKRAAVRRMSHRHPTR